MYGVWSGGFQTQRSTKENLERGFAKRQSNIQIQIVRVHNIDSNTYMNTRHT